MMQPRPADPGSLLRLVLFPRSSPQADKGNRWDEGRRAQGTALQLRDKSSPGTDLPLPSEHMDGTFQSQRCEHPHVKLRFCVMKAL